MVTFTAASEAGSVGVPVSFGDEPVARGISDPLAETLEAGYEDGTVILTGGGAPAASPTPGWTPGDIDGDSDVDAADLFAFSLWWQTSRNETNLRCDIVEDAAIDALDLYRLIEAWRGSRVSEKP